MGLWRTPDDIGGALVRRITSNSSSRLVAPPMIWVWPSGVGASSDGQKVANEVKAVGEWVADSTRAATDKGRAMARKVEETAGSSPAISCGWRRGSAARRAHWHDDAGLVEDR